MTTLCLVAMFKNEACILNEWMAHYLKQGVNKFFLINNGSTDNFLPILQPYINNHTVELINDDIKHAQEHCYNKYFLTKAKKYQWVMVVDLDEFVYARKGYRTIPQYLHTLNDTISQVCIPWKIFGSNGHKVQPQNVVKSFSKRINYNKEDGFQGVIKDKKNHKYSFDKCIVRTKFLTQFGIHHHKTTNDNWITSDNNNNNLHPNRAFSKINEQILQHSYLHLNHYAIQSYDWFMAVKKTRGAANEAVSEYVRNESYFVAFDNVSNDIDDHELSSLTDPATL